jgi:hypothetical protein
MLTYSSIPAAVIRKVQKSESPQRRKKYLPWGLRIKTFRKFFFSIYSRRSGVNPEG